MHNRFIDLYSDTKTKPTPAMRQAMANAEVGDEQKDEDPTVLRLAEKVCALLGKEAAVFLPSGTMCNEIALAVHCQPGDEVICERTAHIVTSEAGGPAALARVMIQPIDGERGMYTGAQLKDAIRMQSRYTPRSRLAVVEHSSNLGGGTVWPLQRIREVAEIARQAKLALHMDGARLFNATVASGVAPASYAAPFDTAWIDFTKGLGAPVGAMLAGSKEQIQEAWRWKQRLGGAMRQAGIIAAAGLYALDHHVERLAEDHENAKALARGLAEIDGIAVDAGWVETNIVFFEVTKPGWTAAELVQQLKPEGVGLGAFGPRRIRAVTHLDIGRADIDRALAAIRTVLQQRRH
jgi:threonine aldolase